MSDLGEIFQAHREAQKERRAERLPIRQDEILSLEREGFNIVQLTPYQFRINHRLDLYPTHNRYHDIKRNKRGGYKNAIEFVRRFKWEETRPSEREKGDL